MSVGTLDLRAGPVVAVMLLLAFALAGATLVRAEVVGTKDVAPVVSAPSIHEDPVALECWQKGRRIIHREGLSGLAVKAVSKTGAVAFKPADSDQPEIFLLPFEDSLCLVSPED